MDGQLEVRVAAAQHQFTAANERLLKLRGSLRKHPALNWWFTVAMVELDLEIAMGPIPSRQNSLERFFTQAQRQTQTGKQFEKR